MDVEAAPNRKPAHVIGEPIDALSIRDFADRIAMLHAEIDRLETAKRQKQAALDAAGSIFRS